MPQDMSEQLIYPIGIDDLFIVMMTKNETGNNGPEYNTKIWRLPVITKLKIKGNGKTSDKYASNKLFARVSKETQHELSLSKVAMPVALVDEMRGLQPQKGVAFTRAKATEKPFFAFGFIGPYSQEQNNGVWYPRCQLNVATEGEYETTGADVKIADTTLSITASALLNNNVLYTDYNSARKSASELTIDQYMKQVIFDESQLAKIDPKPPVTAVDHNVVD